MRIHFFAFALWCVGVGIVSAQAITSVPIGGETAFVSNVEIAPKSAIRRATLAKKFILPAADGEKTVFAVGSAIEYHPYLRALVSAIPSKPVSFALPEGAFRFMAGRPIRFDADAEGALIVTEGFLADSARVVIGPFVIDAKPAARIAFSAFGVSSVTAEWGRGSVGTIEFELCEGAVLSASSDMSVLSVTSSPPSTITVQGRSLLFERAEIDLDRFAVRSAVLAPRSTIVFAAQQVPVRSIVLNEAGAIDEILTAGAGTFENIHAGTKTAYKYGSRLFVAYDRSALAFDRNNLPEVPLSYESVQMERSGGASETISITFEAEIDPEANADFVNAYDAMNAKRARVRFIPYGETNAKPLYDGEAIMMTDRKTQKTFARLKRSIDVPQNAMVEALVTVVTTKGRFLKSSTLFNANARALTILIPSDSFVYSTSDASPLPRIGRPIDVTLRYRIETAPLTDILTRAVVVPEDSRMGVLSIFPAKRNARAYTNIPFSLLARMETAGVVTIPRAENAGVLYVRALWYAPDGRRYVADDVLSVFPSSSSSAMGRLGFETNVHIAEWRTREID